MARIRRPWTWEEVEKLLNMAQKYSAAQIASEIGRPIPSVRAKAHVLAISLRMDRDHGLVQG
jgi:bifunctional pyridoxal-dependent enzyme with beta-cystathionase and maltose regulon repressor activities